MTAYGQGPGPQEHARPDVEDISIGEVLGQVGHDLSLLMRKQAQLAAAEIKEEATKAGRVAGALAGAGFAGYMVLLFTSIAVWRGLAVLIPDEWAAVVVAAVWAVAGAAFAVNARAGLRRIHPQPQRTVDTLKRVPDALRGQ